MNPLTQTFLGFLLLAGLVLPAAAQDSIGDVDVYQYQGPVAPERGVNPGIASGAHSGIYIRFGQDISDMCEHFGETSAGGLGPIRVNVFTTHGSFDSIKRLRTEDEVQLAIVQSDIWYYADRHSNEEHMQQFYPDQVDSAIMDAWADIKEDINMIIPLYTEAIHVLVRGDAADNYKDLMSLVTSGATVNVGVEGSGTAITTTLIEQMLIADPSVEVNWIKRHYHTDHALDLLAQDRKNQPNNDDQLDAVVFVGGVPYPPLQQFGLKRIKETVTKKRLFGLAETQEVVEKEVSELVLLPLGDEMDRVILQNSENFGGYFHTEIQPGTYSFITKNSEPVDTRGVTACLVTHAAYDEQAGEESHKINWVRHIVKRMLLSLSSDPNSRYGVNSHMGVPHAKGMWKDVADNLSRIHEDHTGLITWETRQERGQIHWNDFGWTRHPDAKLTEMVDLWIEHYGHAHGSDKVPPIFDPRIDTDS